MNLNVTNSSRFDSHQRYLDQIACYRCIAAGDLDEQALILTSRIVYWVVDVSYEDRVWIQKELLRGSCIQVVGTNKDAFFHVISTSRAHADVIITWRQFVGLDDSEGERMEEDLKMIFVSHLRS
ncbi:hypothetical protein KQX54_021327 [Cotesia glomerata]|uniref:Uncharacterized protein n=1 Tax=Cotesia glomerata TaxID=32391 RepID=A0AAV7IUV8_COTGL|nr:hypothetical protein KQX54_021327 [Cotesia glomerata]